MCVSYRSVEIFLGFIREKNHTIEMNEPDHIHTLHFGLTGLHECFTHIREYEYKASSVSVGVGWLVGNVGGKPSATDEILIESYEWLYTTRNSNWARRDR